MKKMQILWLMTLLLLTGAVTSCSEQTDEVADEFANWQQRNDQYFSSLDGRYNKLKVYYKDAETPGSATDYIYYEVLEQGDGTFSPTSEDSVLVAYRGRLIPTDSYELGYEFTRTFTSKEFEWNTARFIKNIVKGYTAGFATALYHMRAGDHWRIYVPYTLGYKAGGDSSAGIPGYSTLIFEIALKDCWTQAESRPEYN